MFRLVYEQDHPILKKKVKFAFGKLQTSGLRVRVNPCNKLCLVINFLSQLSLSRLWRLSLSQTTSQKHRSLHRRPPKLVHAGWRQPPELVCTAGFLATSVLPGATGHPILTWGPQSNHWVSRDPGLVLLSSHLFYPSGIDPCILSIFEKSNSLDSSKGRSA